MRPEIKAHIIAIIDSFSDDETADFLGIGTRQVRRRAQQGGLHFFVVGKKRRYGTWQFHERLGVLPGLQEIIPSIPVEWSPERVHEFMTTLESGLNIHGHRVAPRTWLAAKGNPATVAKLILSNPQA